MEYTPPLQYQIRQSLRRFVSFSLLTAGLIVLVRLYEIMSFPLTTGAPEGSTMELIYGIRFDILLALRLSALLLIPFFLIDHFSPKMAGLFFSVVAVIVVIAEVILVRYFSITRIPLGSDIPVFSLPEIQQAVLKSVKLDLALIVPVISFLAISIYVFYKWFYLEVTRSVIVLYLLLVFGSLLAMFNSEQYPAEFKNELTRNIASNKLSAFCESMFNYYWKTSNPTRF